MSVQLPSAEPMAVGLEFTQPSEDFEKGEADGSRDAIAVLSAFMNLSSAMVRVPCDFGANLIETVNVISYEARNFRRFPAF